MREWIRFAIASIVVVGAWGCSSGGSSDDGNLVGDAGDDGTFGDGFAIDGGGDTTVGFDIGGDSSACKKTTCAAAGANCGPIADGCGGLLDCGKCTVPGDICGGGGKASVCGTAPCTKKTCADLGAECGKQGDGCGGVIDCGSCTAPATCGGGGTPNKCGTSVPPCTPKTCTDMKLTCGKNADGCGGIVDCGTCTAPDTCGGGGTFSVCGHTTSPCVAKTCASYPGSCGVQSDGCGGLTPSCGTCTAPATCGGGGTPSVCGGGPPPCTPKTCADFPGLCGEQSDGCGGLTASCGACTAPETCGGGGVPSTCGGGPPPCTKKTCADFPGTCGPQSDGCGGLTPSCGSCTPPQSCGGGGVPGVCGGAPLCTPKTCAAYPGTCGPQSDGCGGLTASCGTCTAPAICGGAGVPGVCGGGGGTTCVGLACKQVTCTGTATTSISGTVYDPAGNHPLPNVFVYVPNCPVGSFTPGVSCDKCSAALQGCPLVTTTTDVNGKFTLPNMPVDTGVPVVIQIGRWRRQITVTTSKCANVPVAATLTHLPRNKSEGDIPKIALTTGWADPLECLLRKIGISDSEFTNPDGTGRVNLFEGQDDSATYGPGYTPTASYDPSLGGAAFPDATQLWSQVTPNLSASPPIYGMSGYDVVLLGCEGSAVTSNKPDLTVMSQYTNIGGRVFGEHFHYTWVDFGSAPWPSLMTWRTSSVEYFENCYISGTCNPLNETVLTTLTSGAAFPKGSLMNQWMQNVGAASTATPSLFPVNDARHSISTVNDTTNVIQWIQAPKAHASTAGLFGYTKGSTYTNMPEYVSFNTPVGAAPDSVCGRFVFSDIHVSSGDSVDMPFPTGCSTTTMTPQELALEFMFFDLASRVCDETTPPPPPTCTPTTCAAIGATCGAAPDGCGGTLSCGTCPSGSICSTGGKCASSPCTPATCSGLGHTCGAWPDGCGGTLSCGTCTPPASCGGSGIPGTCGGSSCTPTTCAALGHDCGSWSDGCGGTLNCGVCTPPATCGGGGVVGKCGGTSCVPTTCAKLGYDCGSWADGCGGTLSCGVCTPPATCGGGGATGKCGSPPPCTPKTCATAGVSCGPAGDGCGGTIDCGPCDGGTPCVPLTCGGRCGLQGDGCGGVITCPPCDGGVCTPTTCAAAGAECGSYPDGCGGLLDCGTCTPPATCGGGGTPNKCGSIK